MCPLGCLAPIIGSQSAPKWVAERYAERKRVARWRMKKLVFLLFSSQRSYIWICNRWLGFSYHLIPLQYRDLSVRSMNSMNETRWYVSLVILNWTHVSRVEPRPGTFRRTLYRLSYSARAWTNQWTIKWNDCYVARFSEYVDSAKRWALGDPDLTNFHSSPWFRKPRRFLHLMSRKLFYATDKNGGVATLAQATKGRRMVWQLAQRPVSIPTTPNHLVNSILLLPIKIGRC